MPRKPFRKRNNFLKLHQHFFLLNYNLKFETELCVYRKNTSVQMVL